MMPARMPYMAILASDPSLIPFTTSDAMITGIRAKNARVSLCISDLGVEMADGRVGAQHRRY